MDESIIAKDIRILVVDDNMVNAMVLSAMIEHYGIKVDTAESGMEAIEMVCGVKYDIVLMDYLMPDMDGVETTRQIMFVSEGQKKPKVIGVSATVDTQVTDLFIDAGADCVLKKPVRTEDFEMKLKQYGLVQGEIEESDDEAEGCIDSAAFLSSVEGLDYDEGISLMAGSLDNYMRVLNVSLKNISENYNKLDVIRNTRQLDVMAMHFHSLKGIFLNIGASMLASNSKAMEAAAKKFESMYINANIDTYMDMVKKFHSQLEMVCGLYNEKVMNKKSSMAMEETEFVKNLDALKENIENFEYIEITDLLEDMIAGSEGGRAEKLQDIYDYIQNFQYDEALEILNSMYG